MRIGITCYPTYGGSGAVATELGLELARRGHEVHFISYASPFRLRGGFAERVTFHEVVTADYPLFEHSPYALALAVKQHEVAVREELELMHVHYAIPHAATAWLAKQMLKTERDLKVVTTLHGTDITLVGQDPSYFTITKFSIEQSDRVTAVSQYLRDETYRAFGCVDCDVQMIPNFVSTAEYYPARDGSCRRALAPPDHKILTHVSNFRPVKRVRDVVRIFAGVRKALPATLVLIGDGPDRDAAEQETDRLRLGDDVRFLGKVDQVADLLRGRATFRLSGSSRTTRRCTGACSVTELARLVRLPNLVLAAAGVVAGGWIAMARIALPAPLALAALCGAALGAYGFIRNDIADFAADAVSHPDRPIPSGRIHPETADWYARWALLAAMGLLLWALRAGAPPLALLPCFLAAWGALGGYSPGLKRLGLGNVAVALVGGLPLFFGAAAVNRPRDGLVPWAIAAWIPVLRELVKDIEDEPGDQAVRRRTLPILIGRP